MEKAQGRLDWKWLLMLVATVSGVVIPVWIWTADSGSKGLQLRLVSQTAIQPAESDHMAGLKITVDGKEIASPFVSVIELVNPGTEPVPSSAYESPIELSVPDGVSIVRARITETRPSGLRPHVSVNENHIEVSPLLLNPDDSITIAVITTGFPTQFEPRARILGISEIHSEDQTKPQRSIVVDSILLAAGVLCLVVAQMVRPDKEGVYLRKRAAVGACVITLVVGAGPIGIVANARGLDSFWAIMMVGVLVAAIAGIIAIVLNAPPKTSPSSERL